MSDVTLFSESGVSTNLSGKHIISGFIYPDLSAVGSHLISGFTFSNLRGRWEDETGGRARAVIPHGNAETNIGCCCHGVQRYLKEIWECLYQSYPNS